MDRKSAHAYLSKTLRSLVPDRVIDDLWDRLVSPLYDRPDKTGQPDSPSGQTAPCPGRRPDDVRTVLGASGHYHSCVRCRPDNR